MKRFFFYFFISLFFYLFISSFMPPVQASCGIPATGQFTCPGSCSCPSGYTGSCECVFSDPGVRCDADQSGCTAPVEVCPGGYTDNCTGTYDCSSHGQGSFAVCKTNDASCSKYWVCTEYNSNCPANSWSNWSPATCYAPDVQTRYCTYPGINDAQAQTCPVNPNDPVNGVCGATHYNCSVGPLGPYAEYGDQWQWWCNGTNGGTNTWCQEIKKGRIQGRRVSSSGPSSTLTRITVSGVGNYDLYNHWETYSTGDILPFGSSYTVSTTVPAGYTASYSVCNNCVDHPTFTPGSSVNVTIPSTAAVGYYTAYVDLYWQFTPAPVNGVCAATHYNCSAGTSASNVSGATAWTWGCNGLYGGTSTSATACSENKPINGVCSNPNTHYTCSAGTSASNVSGATAWTWGCNGLYGGTSTSATACSENKPTTPVGTCGTFNTTNATTPVTWTWANGTGLRVRETTTGAWWYNTWATSPLTIYGIPPGTALYALSTYDFVNFSNQGLISPLPYCPLPDNQTAVISGVLRQKSGTGCYQADASNNFNISALSGSTGDSCVTVETPCTFSFDQQHAVSYSCTVTWDNQACVAQGRQPNTAQTLTLTSGATGYSTGQFSNASCTLGGTTLPITAGINNSTADIAFTFSGNNWIKLKESSFNGISITGVTVPAFVNSYDVNDDATKYFIIGNAGAVLKATVNPSSAYSSPPKNWHDSSYPAGSSSMNPTAFLSYVKSRKQYTKIDNSDSDLSTITSPGIYVYDGPLTLTSSNITTSNVVIIATGDVTINGTQFNIANDCIDTTSSKNIAILSTTGKISFSNTTQCAAGIFIAQTIDTGSTGNQGLKIKGNLIALTTLTNGRAWSDTSRPGLFIVFDPVQYTNLLPYLSTASYQWRQVQ